jgi:hypothetical protein
VSAAERIGAPAQIRLSQLSIFNSPRPEGVIAVLKGYFDDSQTTGRFWAVGGYLGTYRQWEKFEKLWPAALAEHGVPYFHKREIGKPNGVYKKWYPLGDHPTELEAFFRSLVKVIADSGITRFCSLVRMGDLERFNLEVGLRLEPYPLAAYGCMLLIGSIYRDVATELVFDHLEKVTSKIAKAQEYADSDSQFKDWFGKIVPIPLAKDLTFKDIIPLQAADLSVWEYRKDHLGVSDWFDTDRPADPTERRKHYERWSLQKFGVADPPMRKSAAALLESSGFRVIVWDYENLRETHESRGGVWSLD